MKENKAYLQKLTQESPFHLRHAIERLREGLFDPIAVRLLTAHEDKLDAVVERCFQKLEIGEQAHLCVCGSYGQGKSHSLTYIQQKALEANYVTSMVNLDLREVPLHDFRQIYRALLANIQFPEKDVSFAAQWKDWTQQEMHNRNDLPNGVVDLLPANIPHLFRSILVGIAQKNVSLSARQKKAKKYANFRPREFSYLLERALGGDVIPVNKLRNALKYRQVSFYREGSLASKGIDIYLQMISGLTKLFQQFGYRGWVLLFDEGESIAQVRISSRSRSYQILHRLFFQEELGKLFPVFAFTDDFFQCVQNENYERTYFRKEEEIPYFPINYSEAWEDLNVYRLEDLSKKEWEGLIEKLAHLYASAYQQRSSPEAIFPQMMAQIVQLQGEETRYQLKALINQLDVIYQEQIL
ncbi:MAG: DUF2791 family P-loop domain-containing protein [SAR324 cluster bacterium]|nr:DUF2791 family P-loop domain-containing protein [SAR324 cluster bacterium]